MIGLRDDRGEEGDWVWASISRGGQTNRSYSNRDVRKRREKGQQGEETLWFIGNSNKTSSLVKQ
jgi:hypothetical protein